MSRNTKVKNRHLLEERAQKYWKSAIDNNCQDISSAKKGNRNNQIHKSVYALGQLYQALCNKDINPNPSELEIKPDIYRAVKLMQEPLPENEYFYLVINSFAKGKTNPMDLSHLEDNNTIRQTDKDRNNKQTVKTQKVQIRWISENQGNRFSFMEVNKLKHRDVTQEDIDEINNLQNKYFEIDAFKLLDIKIHHKDSRKGIIFWGTDDKIYNPLEIEDKIIFLEGRTDLLTAVTFRLFEKFKLVSKYNKESKIYIDNPEALHIFFMDDDVNDEHIISKIFCNTPVKCKFIRFPHGKDYSEYAYLGGYRDLVMKLIEETEIKEVVRKTATKDVMTANERLEHAKSLPPIKKLFGQIIHKNELVILFGPSGCGKSILSVQMAEAFANGDSLFDYPNEAGKQKVLYFDFELSHQQFLKRYSDNFGNPHTFTDNLLFYNLNLNEIIDSINGKNLQDYMFDKICQLIQETKATVIIIDNITYLDSESLTDGDKALKMMKILNKIKIEKKVTIIVVAHTPKRKNTNKLTIGDLAGSSNISNFADNVIGMNISDTEKNFRYMKQVKASRSAPIELDDNNVLILEINKTDKLYFKTVKYDVEKNHIKEMNNSDIETQEKIKKVVKLLEQGKTYEGISNELGISKGTISKWRKKHPEQFKGGT